MAAQVSWRSTPQGASALDMMYGLLNFWVNLSEFIGGLRHLGAWCHSIEQPPATSYMNMHSVGRME